MTNKVHDGSDAGSRPRPATDPAPQATGPVAAPPGNETADSIMEEPISQPVEGAADQQELQRGMLSITFVEAAEDQADETVGDSRGPGLFHRLAEREALPTKLTDVVLIPWDFLRTRRAILDGEPLYDQPELDRREKHYLGPWRFNLTETFLAGLPGLLLSWFVSLPSPFTYPSVPDLFADPNLSSEHVLLAQRIFRDWVRGLAPFFPAVVLTISAYTSGSLSLWMDDSSPERRRRARVAYLYLDGAHGLWRQMFAGFVSAMGWATGGSLGLAVGIASLTSLGLLVHESHSIVPRELFYAHGYGVAGGRWANGPWKKYLWLGLGSSGWLAATLIVVAVWTLEFFSVVLAGLRVAIQ